MVNVIKPITTRFPYSPPLWARDILTNHPLHGRLKLGNLPTPVHQVVSTLILFEEKNYDPPSTRTNKRQKQSIVSRFLNQKCNLYIKHDDATGGVELGGNKVRKLEFLLADALAQKCHDVITIGGEQSNHCRATAGACRKVGLQPHLILRTRRKAKFVNEAEDDEVVREKFGFVGNILFDRLMGSHIYLVSPGEYGRFGSKELVRRVCELVSSSSSSSSHPSQTTTQKEMEGGSEKKTYSIPVGGSNGIGTWGYIEAVKELILQWEGGERSEADAQSEKIDHIVFATGSGGTSTGIVLGIALAYEFKQEPVPKMHAIGVCDDPDYFYGMMASIAGEMGFAHPSGISAKDFIMKHVTVYQGKGLGYALSTEEELDFVNEFAIETGVALDPVYSGKALYHFVTNVMMSSKAFKGSNILFWHTGGALGMYDKGEALPLDTISPVVPMDLYGQKE